MLSPNAERSPRYLHALLLAFAGIALNLLCARLALHFGWPVFLDSIGTILAAMLGGYLPGILVGFASNVVNGLADPITMYYATVSVLIAAAAAHLSRYRFMRTPWRILLSAVVFALIGGGLGSLVTWLLYGFNFGAGISASYALALYEQCGFTRFWAQFTADMGIDLLDKLVSVLIVLLVLHLLPNRFLRRFPYGAFCLHGKQKEGRAAGGRYGNKSLRNQVVFLIVATALILGTLATSIVYVSYQKSMEKRYSATVQTATTLMARVVNGNLIDGWLEDGANSTYAITEQNLKRLREAMPDIEYMYVYQMCEDGCRVVFDLDTETLQGDNLGDFIEYEEAFLPYLDDLLHGQGIPPIVSNGKYGWLLTSYRPIMTSFGRTVAYVGADIAMQDIIADRYTFIIRILVLLFGASIAIVMLAIWLADRKLVTPLNAMTAATNAFAYDSEAERKRSTENILTLKIETGNEIQALYTAICKMAGDVDDYLRLISGMQRNFIVSIARMVENRDENTGEHIHRTAQYVHIIATRMQASGLYPGILSDEYIARITESAPLHDVGKIHVSDTILNKPGKLTAEEFRIMQEHTVVGRAILRGVTQNISKTSYLFEAAEMAGSHHERWDGAGYPDHLRGEEIPLSARIMAVADVYDALVSKRSYKDAMSPEAALAILKEESGSHFDPNVVQAFVDAFDEIRGVSQA